MARTKRTGTDRTAAEFFAGAAVVYQTREMLEERDARYVRPMDGGGHLVDDGGYERVVLATDSIRRFGTVSGDAVGKAVPATAGAAVMPPAPTASVVTVTCNSSSVSGPAPTDSVVSVPGNTNAVSGPARSHSAVSVPGNTTLAQRDLELTIPEDLAQIAMVIRKCLTDERIGGMRAALLIAHVRATSYPEENQYKAWVEWGRTEFTISDKRMCMYQRAGALLLSSAAAALPHEQRAMIMACAVHSVAQLGRLEGRMLGPFLEKHNASEISRDDLVKFVNTWLLSPDKQKLLAAAEEKRKDAEFQAKTPSGRMARATTEILKLEGLIGQAVPDDPVATARAGLILQQASLNTIEAQGGAKPKAMADLVQSLETLLEFARGLLAKSANG